MTPMAVVRVASIGTRPTGGFRCPGGPAVWHEPVYPEENVARGRRFADLRRQLRFGLREAYRALGVTAEQCSGLEWGRYTFGTEVEWTEAEERLRACAPITGAEFVEKIHEAAPEAFSELDAPLDYDGSES